MIDISAIPSAPLVAAIEFIIGVLLLGIGLWEWFNWKKQQRAQ